MISTNGISEMSRVILKIANDKKNNFTVGQRVIMSRAGMESLSINTGVSMFGVVAECSNAYPDAIAVIRDGAKRKMEYHQSYWESA